MKRLLRAIAVSAGILVSLSGCFFAFPFGSGPVGQSRDGDGDRDAVRPGGTPAAVCVDDEARIAGEGDFEIGDCARVFVEGTDIDLDAGSIEVLEIRGDRIEVDVDSVGEVTMEGQDNTLDATDAASVTIRGDRNEVDVDGVVGSLEIGGNENEVDAERIDAIVDQGDRNRVDASN